MSWSDECEHYIDEHYVNKTFAFSVGWDGDEGLVSLDKLLLLVQTYFPNIPHSSIGISISQESTIIVFDKVDVSSEKTEK